MPDTQTSKRRREIDSLTAVRGFAASWVVLYHFWPWLVILFPALGYLSAVAEMGFLAVPFFFILSGFILSYNYASLFNSLRREAYLQFLAKRLIRIYPVHAFTLLIVLAMVLVSRGVGWELDWSGYTLETFIENCFLVQTWVPDFYLNWNYPSWSISSEWFAYIWFPFACVLTGKFLGRYRSALIASLAAYLTAILIYHLPTDLPFKTLIIVCPTFFLGMCIYYLVSSGPDGPVIWRYMPEALLVVVAASCFLPNWTTVICAMLAEFSLIIFWLARLGNGCSIFWTNRFSHYLGKVSYSVYMAHALALKVIVRVLPAEHFQHSSVWSRSGVVGLYATLIAFFCLGTYYLVEAPMQKSLTQFMRNRTVRQQGQVLVSVESTQV